MDIHRFLFGLLTLLVFCATTVTPTPPTPARVPAPVVRGGASTDKRYSPIFNKWFPKFLSEAGLDASAQNWVGVVADVAGGVVKHRSINTDVPKRFLSWIFDGVVNSLTQTSEKTNTQGKLVTVEFIFTPGIWQTALSAVWSETNRQLTALDLPKVEDGYIRKLPGIDDYDKRINEFKTQSDNDNQIDMQGCLHTVLSAEKMDEGMRFLYSWADSDAFREKPIPRVCFTSALRCTIALGCRCEDMRYHKLATMFTCQLKGIGPDPKGMTALGFIGNQGKVNKSGRHTKQGMLPHISPLLCPVASVGLNFLYRYQVNFAFFQSHCKIECRPMTYCPPLLKVGTEPHPVFTQFTTLFGAFLCRASLDSGAQRSATYASQRNAFEGFFKQLEFDPPVKTHYGRGEAYITCDELGVHPEQVDRLANRIHDAKHNSYATNFPRDALVAIAGGDHQYQSAFCVTHLLPMDMSVVEEALPWIKDEREKLQSAVAEAGAACHGKMSSGRLYCAQGKTN